MENKQIQRALRLRGLEIRPSALLAIKSVLKREPDQARALDAMANALKERISLLKSLLIVDEDMVKQVALALSKDEEDEEFDSIQIVDSFSIPAVTYHPGSRSFQVQKGGRELQGGPESKSQLLRTRLAFVHQRLMRNPLFKLQLRNSVHGGGIGDGETVYLTPIEQLAAGGGDSKQLHQVLGVLVRIDDHRLWLEDGNGKLPLDLSLEEMQAAQGFFTVGCVVIVTGHLVNLMEEDGGNEKSMGGSLQHVFRVSALVMPPKEDRVDSELAHPGCGRRMLGLPNLSSKDELRMSQMELEADGTFFVLLSDVHLDDPDTMDSLRQVFEGFAESPPQLFVLMGNFSHKPFALTGNSEQFTSPQEFGDLFDNLASLVLRTPSLLTNKTRWVFVPGSRDPSLAPMQMLPRPGLPEKIAKRFTDRLPLHARVSFTTNPCRILFYNQEICIFRNNSMSQMQHHCVLQTNGMDEYLVRTICNQAHLCPVLDSKPTYLPYCESALRLFPLPHLIVLADRYDQYEWNNQGCVVMNPGSFSSDGSFVVYLPAQEKIDFSRVQRGGGGGV
ncbi:hypothetical protein BASA81_003030 [Batrachochytrium salamandrivorans]|nr:hypothetical protein BASA81_003030 [Batrachochytrium salamandrivorans]